MRGIQSQRAQVFKKKTCDLRIIWPVLVEYPELVNALVKLEEFDAIDPLKTKKQQASTLEKAYLTLQEERKPVIHEALENTFIAKAYELEATQWLKTHHESERDCHSLVTAFLIITAKALDDGDTLKYNAYFKIASLLNHYKENNAAKPSVIAMAVANFISTGGEKNGKVYLSTSDAFQQLFKGSTINYNKIKIVRDRFFQSLFRMAQTNNAESSPTLTTQASSSNY